MSDSNRDHPDHSDMARAVYDASIEHYLGFVGTEIGAATEAPIDRAVLAVFAELMVEAPAGRIADLGCGPGRVAAYLARCGLDTFGVDVSPEMVRAARAAHPGIDFHEGPLTALPIGDRSLVGAVCWYSIIHTSPDELGQIVAELHRVVVPGGHLVVAFQIGADETVFRPEAHGTGLPLISFLHHPDTVTDALANVGLAVHTRVVRDAQLAHETTAQAFLIAQAGRPERPMLGHRG